MLAPVPAETHVEQPGDHRHNEETRKDKIEQVEEVLECKNDSSFCENKKKHALRGCFID